MGLRTILASAVLAALCGAAAAQERVQLKISSFTPPPHWTNSQLFQPWAQELEKKSGGKVRAQLFAGNSAFGKIENQTDQVKAGATDLAWVMNGVPRGRFLRSLIMDLPFMAPDAHSSTRAMWAMLPTHLKEDYAGFKVLAITCHNAGDFFFRERKVERIEEVKSLRVRSPSSQVQAWLQHVGAVPVTMGPGQIYESLEKGTMDGILTVYDGIRGFRLESLVEARAFGARLRDLLQHHHEPGEVQRPARRHEEADRRHHRRALGRDHAGAMGQERRGGTPARPEQGLAGGCGLRRAARQVARAGEAGDRPAARRAREAGHRQRARDPRRDAQAGRALLEEVALRARDFAPCAGRPGSRSPPCHA